MIRCLRDTRVEQVLSVREMARLTGIDLVRYCAIERGKVAPTSAEQAKIETVLGVVAWSPDPTPPREWESYE